jgi:cell wall-associated NlpC family hydrolase
MRKSLAHILPLALVALLSGCAGQPVQQTAYESASSRLLQSHPLAGFDFADLEQAEEDSLASFDANQDYQLPLLADSILQRGLTLLGTPYRFGGSSASTGFDCSGFVSFVFRKEAGIDLPRSTGEMIKLDAPKVARDKLQPGDLVFFNNRGRGRVSHAGIYIGDDQFIHSSSSRSGGVRVDSLDDKYWRASYMEAKRVLAMAPELESTTFSR